MNNEYFCFFFLNPCFFLSLSYFTALIRTSRMMLNKLKVMNLCLIPDFKRKIFQLFTIIWMFALHFFVNTLNWVKSILFYPYFAKNINVGVFLVLKFIKCFCCNNCGIRMAYIHSMFLLLG